MQVPRKSYEHNIKRILSFQKVPTTQEARTTTTRHNYQLTTAEPHWAKPHHPMVPTFNKFRRLRLGQPQLLSINRMGRSRTLRGPSGDRLAASESELSSRRAGSGYRTAHAGPVIRALLEQLGWGRGSGSDGVRSSEQCPVVTGRKPCTVSSEVSADVDIKSLSASVSVVPFELDSRTVSVTGGSSLLCTVARLPGAHWPRDTESNRPPAARPDEPNTGGVGSRLQLQDFFEQQNGWHARKT